MSDKLNLEELDWRKVRLITMEGTSITVLLEEGVQRRFEFRNENELSLALRLWGEQEERARDLLQRNGTDRASSPNQL